MLTDAEEKSVLWMSNLSFKQLANNEPNWGEKKTTNRKGASQPCGQIGFIGEIYFWKCRRKFDSKLVAFEVFDWLKDCR